MVTEITAGVEINVEVVFQEMQIAEHKTTFLYAYKIHIINHNLFTIQLLRRKWIITNGFAEHHTVEGNGVIDRQPILYPNDDYSYISGTQFFTPIGKMEGIYFFENKTNKDIFEVKIPTFILESPTLLN